MKEVCERVGIWPHQIPVPIFASHIPQVYHTCISLHLSVWEAMSHLVSYAMLTRPNKAEAAVHGC